MDYPNSAGSTGVHVLDEADWAILSTGLLKTDPPLVVEALTFTIADYLRPLFDHLVTIGGEDTDTLGQLVAEAAGVEFDSFGATKILHSASPEEFAAQVGPVLRDLLGMTGIEDNGELATELAELRLPVFRSQPRDSKPLREWGAATGTVLTSVAFLAGTHAPALLVLAGPVGAIISLGTYVGFGGAWAAKRVHQRRAALPEAKAADAAAKVAAKTSDEEVAETAAAAEAAAAAAAAAAAMHEMIRRKQEYLKRHRPCFELRSGRMTRKR
jgi:hypothetical protein